ncbi:MAG: uroporphyrinogen-III C-methyltransferase [Dehalococcoidia bacterium]
MSTKGRVSLVGAGPGDPGLITVKALECIKRADVIVYDRLVNITLLDQARPDCDLVFVGKGPGRHGLRQQEINSLLVDRAKEGKYVVRLKGGDPFLFGRGGEEAEALVREGIPFDVVPGVSSVTAVPAYAGIPVTHRRLSSSLAVITGHEDPAKGESSIDWKRLARATDTLVVLMGMGNLATMVQQLLENGREPDTPIALIRWGTTAQQETVEGTLESIIGLVEERGFKPPAVAVMGDVVGLRKELNWYEDRPLFGKRVLVTRSRKQASALSTLLTREGADVIELPALEVHQTEDNIAALDRAIDGLREYQWAVFTSVNGVDSFFERLEARELSAGSLAGLKLVAIGLATAQALEVKGLNVDFVPQEYLAEAMVDEFRKRDIQGERFLLPRAEEARPMLVEGLRELGALVDEAPAYRAKPPSRPAARAMERLKSGQVDIATFASSSTVRNLAQMLNGSVEALKGACVACIGPITAATARELGLEVDVVAQEHTIPGLVEAIVQHVRSRT